MDFYWLHLLRYLGFFWGLIWLWVTPLGAQTDSLAVVQDSLREAQERYRQMLIEQLLEEGYLADDELTYLISENTQEESSRFLLLDVNRVSESELVATGWVSPYAARHFILQRNRRPNGFESLRELKSIPGWDYRTLQLILPHLVLYPQIPNSSWGAFLRRGRLAGHIAYGGVPYPPKESAPIGAIGGAYGAQVAVSYKARNTFSLGVLGASSRYEPLLQKGYPAFDRVGFHADFQLPQYHLSHLILGDFRVRLGMGLVLHHGFMRGVAHRSEEPLPLEPIAPTLAADASQTMRGIAAIWKKGAWQATLFYSSLPRDGRIIANRKAHLYSVQGVHRTPTEWDRRNVLQEQSFGAIGSYLSPQWHVGVGWLQVSWPHYILDAIPHYSEAPHRGGYSKLTYGTIFYRTTSQDGRWCGMGEGAFLLGEGGAVLSRLQYRTLLGVQLAIGVRYISPYYKAPFGGAATHFGRPQDEYGYTLSLDFPRLTHTSIRLLFDRYYTQYKNPRRGSYAALQTLSSFSRGASLISYYRLRTEFQKPLRHSLKIRYTHPLLRGYHIGLEGQLRMQSSEWLSDSLSWGRAFALRLDCRESERLRWGIAAMMYAAERYSEQCYLLSPYVRNIYTRAAYWGQGVVGMFYARTKIGGHWACEIKASLPYSIKGPHYPFEGAIMLQWH